MTKIELEEIRQHKEEIKEAVKEAIKLIVDAKADAAKLIADAASQALKVLLEAKLEANKKSDGDHDLLTELNVLMKGLKEDIKDLKTGTSMKIENHETRIMGLERDKSNYKITIGLYSLLITGVIGLLVYHLFH